MAVKTPVKFYRSEMKTASLLIRLGGSFLSVKVILSVQKFSQSVIITIKLNEVINEITENLV